jgi:hypothetical protein
MVAGPEGIVIVFLILAPHFSFPSWERRIYKSIPAPLPSKTIGKRTWNRVHAILSPPGP